MLRFFLLFSIMFLLFVPGIADAQKKTTAKKKPVRKAVSTKSKTTAAKKTTKTSSKKKTTATKSKRSSSKGKRVATNRVRPAVPVYEAPAYFEPPYNPTLDERPIPKVLSTVDEMPEFEGELNEYLRYSIHYPDSSYLMDKESTVEVRFIVTILGDIRNATLVKPVDPVLDKEALRVVKEMPRWKPGRHKGMYVNVYYTLPVSFLRN